MQSNIKNKINYFEKQIEISQGLKKNIYKVIKDNNEKKLIDLNKLNKNQKIRLILDTMRKNTIQPLLLTNNSIDSIDIYKKESTTYDEKILKEKINKIINEENIQNKCPRFLFEWYKNPLIINKYNLGCILVLRNINLKPVLIGKPGLKIYFKYLTDKNEVKLEEPKIRKINFQDGMLGVNKSISFIFMIEDFFSYLKEEIIKYKICILYKDHQNFKQIQNILWIENISFNLFR